MKMSEFRKLIREEVRKVMKENDEAFLDAVFDTINDQMRAHEISQSDFKIMKAFLEKNESKISQLFSKNSEDGVEQAVDYIIQQTQR
jgi:hypothetical protein